MPKSQRWQRAERCRGEAVVASGGNGKRWQRGEGMLRGRDGGRAERAVPRRGTIVVSPTQLVPEVLAVWGSD